MKEYFCMAHELLAFHSYSLKELKVFGNEQRLDLSAYKNPLEKFLKYASDIFGPIGVSRGLPIPCIEFERPPMPEDKETFFSFVAVIAQGFINALDAQVSDLMAEETTSTSASSFVPATNLVCERGLKMLDASQRMRPNVSLHHHSTVVTLKQTQCGGMYSWLKHLLNHAPVRLLLWQKARKGGKELRDKHRARDLAERVPQTITTASKPWKCKRSRQLQDPIISGSTKCRRKPVRRLLGCCCLPTDMVHSPQQGDLRLLGPPSGQGAGSGARTHYRKVPADLRADSLATGVS
ncbi:hypothetical protein PoB_007534100 [Plakobranchus ocellatus]|uniref:Uncharacterized protein n=1 Tax=Plakobranchus ocellatus TaxID=259542 RepID=A0AAV4DYC7_9GAST|nr:hypothetical protein PoB_007534100 [Plakobranchus ocellatus]